MTGTVKFYNEKSKFGFIKDDDNEGQEYYTHEKHLIDQISDGDRVTFELTDSKRGPVAIDVKLLSE